MTTGPACADLDPLEADALFFDRRHIPTAVRLCMACPVRVACGLEAIDAEGLEVERYGVFGGLRPEERLILARRRRGVGI